MILQTEEKSTWGTATHPFLCRVSEDRVAITYWIAGDGKTSGRAPISWPVYADRPWLHWHTGDPYQLPEKPNHLSVAIESGTRFTGFGMGAFFGPAHFEDGESVVFSRKWQVRRDAPNYMLLRSADQGKTWKAEEGEVHWDEMPIPRVNVEGEAVMLDDGTLLVAGYGRVATSGPMITCLLRSEDRGRSFNYHATVATKIHAPWGGEGAVEPALARAANGDLVCIMRTGSKIDLNGRGTSTKMLQAISKDGGLTWKTERMLINGVMPKLRLLSNGWLVLATGRPGNRLYISTDNGRSWGAEITISSPQEGTTGYSDVLEVEPGRLLVVWDLIHSPTSRVWLWEPKRVNAIMGMFIDVSKRFGE